MIWQDRLENIQFTIVTGDGEVFTPLWKNSQTEQEYKTAIFDFINVPGSFIERREAKSRKYPLTFWFEGEDNITDSERFQVSAADPRAWTVTHPFYGEIFGQPLSMSRNDTDYNITEINVDFWETIREDFPQTNVSIVDQVSGIKDDVLEESAITYATSSSLESQDIVKNSDSLNLMVSILEPLQDSETNSEFQNEISNARSANRNLLSNASNAIQSIQRVIDLPSTYNRPVRTKLRAYFDVYNGLNRVFNTVSDKLFFETIGATVLSSYAVSSVNPRDSDYEVRSEVQEVVTELIDLYNDYLNILDNNQVSIFDVNNTYTPDGDVQFRLQEIITFTVDQLFIFAFEARQERVHFTEKEQNLFVLAHRFDTLDQLDENIERFRQLNNIKLNRLFVIPKDTEIRYVI
jgi:hypothetical protein